MDNVNSRIASLKFQLAAMNTQNDGIAHLALAVETAHAVHAVNRQTLQRNFAEQECARAEIQRLQTLSGPEREEECWQIERQNSRSAWEGGFFY